MDPSMDNYTFNGKPIPSQVYQYLLLKLKYKQKTKSMKSWRNQTGSILARPR